MLSGIAWQTAGAVEGDRGNPHCALSDAFETVCRLLVIIMTSTAEKTENRREDEKEVKGEFTLEEDDGFEEFEAEGLPQKETIEVRLPCSKTQKGPSVPER